MARRAIGHYNNLSANRSQDDLAIYAEFGRRLEARMVQLGWNQSELSRRATAILPKPAKGQVQGHSLGRDRISSYIRGKYLPRPDALAALAAALKCQPEDLMPTGVPSIIHGQEGRLYETKGLDDNRVHIRLDRVISMDTHIRLLEILNAEDKT